MIPVGSNERLALFLPTLDDGGAERVMLQLAASFSARGHAVDLVVAVPGGPLDAQVPPGPRVVSLDASRTILALPALIRYLRRERPVALLSTLEHANVLAIGAGAFARAGVPIVLREANVLLPRAELGRQARLLRGLMRQRVPRGRPDRRRLTERRHQPDRRARSRRRAHPHHLQPDRDRRAAREGDGPARRSLVRVRCAPRRARRRTARAAEGLPDADPCLRPGPRRTRGATGDSGRGPRAPPRSKS